MDLIQAVLAAFGDNRYHDGVELAQQLIDQQPQYDFAHRAKGTFLCLCGKDEQAIPYLRRALELNPKYAETWTSLGNAYRAIRDFTNAVECYEKSLALQRTAPALVNLASAFYDQEKYSDCLQVCQDGLTSFPQYAEMLNLQGLTLAHLGHMALALDCYKRAIEANPDYPVAYNNLLLGAQYYPENFLESIAYAKKFGSQLSSSSEAMKVCQHSGHDFDPEKTLRIGFVSGDFHSHPVGNFLRNVLRHLKSENVVIYAYSNRPEAGDWVTDEIKSCVHAFNDVYGVYDADLAAHIQADGIDILIDLAGHTARNRLSLFVLKPAPIQASWLGYFATTGLQQMDYIIADRWVLPAAEATHFVETPWYLPDAYYCYSPPPEHIRVLKLPALKRKRFTFGCFNNLTKISDGVIQVWAQILHAVPDSHLLFKAKQIHDPGFCVRLLEKFAELGIKKSRLTLEPSGSKVEYLLAFNRVDVALDPFPFPGGATTLDGLWMGVPVITLKGDRFIGHQGETILHNAGLPDWIAETPADYVHKAISVAADRDSLGRLRAGLRAQVMGSPIMDAPRFATNFAKSLRSMWQAHCR